jgi:hypothetical protein
MSSLTLKVRTSPERVSRTVKTPAVSSVATISKSGLRASADLAHSISRTDSWRVQAASPRQKMISGAAERVFMGES